MIQNIFSSAMNAFSFVVFAVSTTLVSAKAENGKPLNKQLFTALQTVETADTLPGLKPQFSFSNTFASGYMRRGIVFNEGLMLQPSATVSYGAFELTGWSNVAAVETGDNAFVPEIDFAASYTYDSKNYGLKPQANFYFYPANWEHISTLELGVEAYYEIESLGFYVNPNLDVADNYGGIYVDYGIYKSGNVNEKFSYDARMLLGWGNKRFCDRYGAEPGAIETNANPKQLLRQDFKSMRLQMTANYRVTDRFSVQPQVTAFRSFMLGYAFDERLVRANASVTCSYAF